MISQIRSFSMEYSGYQPEYHLTLWQSDSPYELYDFAGRRYLGRVLSATLNQEINTGGTFVMSVKKDTYVDQYVLGSYENYIEVETPYSMDGGVQSLVESDPEKLTKWRGMRARTVEYPDRYEVTYEGELSYLSMVQIEPYETTAGGTYSFVSSMLAKYNNGADGQNSHLDFWISSNNVDDGPSVVRSNSSISTPWDEINEKVLKKYNNQVCIYTTTATDSNIGRRVVRVRGLPSEPSGIITGTDILSVSHTIDDTQRAKYWKVYGAKTDPDTEGDLTRISGSYYNANSSRVIAHDYKIYDEISTTATLDTRAQELYNRARLDSDGISFTLLPEKASTLLLGDMYTVQCPRAGISGNYRLTKRTIDVLNPAKNRYTFGTCEKFITR